MRDEVRSTRGVTLVEVAMAIGILSFCAVALMGLLPIMLNISRESREAAVTGRIHQTVANELHENPREEGGTWYFNAHGALLPGTQDADYRAVTTSLEPSRIGSATNVNIRLALLTVESIHRGGTNLTRPIFINHGKNPTD